MKSHIIRVLSVFVLSLSIIACGNKADNDQIPADVVNNSSSADQQYDGDGPHMSFNKTEHDFGEILKGEKVVCTFRFTNTGNADLVISSHTASCGCTVPDYPKGAISPGDSGNITVVFNSNGKKGVQNKSIILITNCQPPSVSIRIKAIVKEP